MKNMYKILITMCGIVSFFYGHADFLKDDEYEAQKAQAKAEKALYKAQKAQAKAAYKQGKRFSNSSAVFSSQRFPTKIINRSVSGYQPTLVSSGNIPVQSAYYPVSPQQAVYRQTSQIVHRPVMQQSGYIQRSYSSPAILVPSQAIHAQQYPSDCHVNSYIGRILTQNASRQIISDSDVF